MGETYQEAQRRIAKQQADYNAYVSRRDAPFNAAYNKWSQGQQLTPDEQAKFGNQIAQKALDTSHAGMGSGSSVSAPIQTGYPAPRTPMDTGNPPVNNGRSDEYNKVSGAFNQSFGKTGGGLNNPNGAVNPQAVQQPPIQWQPVQSAPQVGGTPQAGWFQQVMNNPNAHAVNMQNNAAYRSHFINNIIPNLLQNSGFGIHPLGQ